MKTASVADLRNHFPKLSRWLAQGEQIQITRRGEHLATLVPAAQAPAKPFKMPDFKARHKAIFGDRVFSDEEVRAGREAELGDVS